MRIAFLVGVLVVDTMRRNPEERTAFERERGAEGKEVLDGLVRLVAAMSQQAVIAHADAEAAGDVPEDCRQSQRLPGEKEECSHSTDVEGHHEGCGDPTDRLRK